MEKSVSTRQLTVLIFIAAVAFKMFMLPSLLTVELGRNAYIGMSLYLLIDLALLTLLVIAIKRAKCGMYELTERVLGKVGSKILIFACVAFSLYKVTLTMGELRIFFSESIFEGFGWSLYILPLLALMCYAACNSARFIGRAAQMCIPFIVLAMILMFYLTAGKLDYGNLLPILKDGDGSLFKYTLWLGDYSVLAILIGKVQKGKADGAKWIIGGAIGSAAVALFSLNICAAYGNLNHLIEYGHNLGAMAQHSGTQNFGRLDLIVLTVWISAIVLKLMLYMYAIVRHAEYLTTVKKPLLWGAVAAVILYVLCIFVFSTPAALYGSATGAIRYVGIADQFILPITVCVAVFIGSRHEKE